VSSTPRHRSFFFMLVLAAVVTAMTAVTAASAGPRAGKKPPPPPQPAPSPSSTSTFIKNYADVVSGVEADATPEDVQPTTDGGTIALSTTPSPSGVLVSWLTKLSDTGAIQWQEELGCLSAAPGDYSAGVSLQGTKDGGYVIAGGTIGCGSEENCPALNGIMCGLVEKLTSSGAVSWAKAYDLGAEGASFDVVRPAADGGYVAAGSARDAGGTTVGLVARLDPSGAVVWQSEVGAVSASAVDFAAVAPAADGGYVVTGRSTANSRFSLIVAEIDANGSLVWQHAYNNVSNGSPTSSTQPLAIISTRDGGYAVAGTWNSTSGPGTCCSGPLLLKLDSQGSLQWQQAYSGGTYCFFNGYSETCTSIGGVAYSLQELKDGGFVLAGDSNIEMRDGTPLEPWLARVDASGQLVWQENDYRVNAQTGRPLSEYFAAATVTNAGFFALGSTENYTNGKNELLGVETDADGHVETTCTDEHSTALLSATDPGLVDLAPGLTARSTGPSTNESTAPVQTLTTGGTATPSQC
jgi:hypothetical protein